MALGKLLLALALLAMLPSAAWGEEPSPVIRSVADTRPRLSDEHDRPYFRETQSHRGWEVRTPQFTVFADTSLDDARLAAAHAEQAWQAASNLATQWTAVPREPDFGLNALQVVITREPARERDLPPTTLNVVGIQTQVEINVAPGQLPLREQLVRIREGAAFGMLHAAGLDAIAPPWLISGVAAFAGRAGLSEEALRAGAAVEQLPRFGGQQWRYGRSQADQVAYPSLNYEEAASKAAFLLTASDARHAPALIALIQEAQAAAQTRAAKSDAFALDVAGTATSFERFFAERTDEYEAWKANPNSGQPIFEPAQDVSTDTLATQREMLVLLKLQQRFSAELATKPARAAKIIELGKDRLPVIRRSGASAAPAAFAGFAASLRNPGGQPWATLDAEGRVLFSSDGQRVNELLAPRGASYDFQVENGHAVLVRRAENGPTIRGWLEPNPQDKSRPIARFEVRANQSNVRVKEFKPAVQARDT
jgi:hypothetical protein